MKYYTYVHKRLDTKEVFYVGVGTQRQKVKYTIYGRARSGSGRNVIWKRIAAKHGFTWEIVFESDNDQEVKAKEIELIRLYGRLDNKTGILSNMTDGGDGRLNGLPETYETNRKNLDKYRELRKIKCYQYDLNGKFIREWESITDAASSLGKKTTVGIILSCQGKIKFAYGFVWKYTYEESLGICIKAKKYTKIYQYCVDGNFIKEWSSFKEVVETLTIGNANLLRTCKNPEKFPIAGGFQWRYEKEEFVKKHVRKTNAKLIGKFDLEGNLIQTYKGLVAASIELNVSFKAVSRRILKNSTVNNFKYKYL